MRRLLYYPWFEVHDENWLKFALLYVKELNLIIPSSGDKHLSSLFGKINNETNLFSKYRPSPDEGYSAGLDAMDLIEKIFEKPDRYYKVFQNKFLDVWKEPNSFTYTLFEEKYSYESQKFCLDNKVAKRCDEGIKLPSQLAGIYMSLLANVISDLKSIAAITDNEVLDRISMLLRMTNTDVAQRTEVIQGIINLQLPKNISEIDINKIIKLRNSKYYMKKLDAFHKELDRYYCEIENGATSRDFIDSLNYTISDISSEILKLGPNMATIGMGAWMLYNNLDIKLFEYIKDILGLGALIGSSIQINSKWKNTETRRFSRKYLTDLRRLK